MNAIQRLEFLINAERAAAAGTEKLLCTGNFSPPVRNLMEVDIRKTNLIVQHLELILQELKG